MRYTSAAPRSTSSRASTLICALERSDQQDRRELGEWPFEIGLWVGRAATPNGWVRRGQTTGSRPGPRPFAFKNDDGSRRDPAGRVPLVRDQVQGRLVQPAAEPRHADRPARDLHHRDCAQPGPNAAHPGGGRADLPPAPLLPDRHRRQFAAMPWTARSAPSSDESSVSDRNGFYGPCQPAVGHPLPAERLLPPDLIVQDELAPDLRPARHDGRPLRDGARRAVHARGGRPPGSAPGRGSTPRSARRQPDRALSIHRLVDIFPPPGPDGGTPSSRGRSRPRRATPASIWAWPPRDAAEGGHAARLPDPDGRRAESGYDTLGGKKAIRRTRPIRT